ncbi:MAG: hypothetical protein SPI25_06855 [Dialister sp.]|nr:hypothetical protein [Dialister sp.]
MTLADLDGETVHFIQDGRIHDSDRFREKREQECPGARIARLIGAVRSSLAASKK